MAVGSRHIRLGRTLERLLLHGEQLCTFECCGSAAYRLPTERVDQWRASWGPTALTRARDELIELRDELMACSDESVVLETSGEGAGPAQHRAAVLGDVDAWRSMVDAAMKRE